MQGRRYNEGLHQAIEAKEGVSRFARKYDIGYNFVPELFQVV